MTEPEMPQKGPYVVDCEPGTYAWCACGLSNEQPYCDGSHAGTGIVPHVERIESARRIAWCGCKHSQTPPVCDGSHSRL